MNNTVNLVNDQTTIGIDLAKNVFHIFTYDANGKPMKKKLNRNEVLHFFAKVPPCLVAMEACGGAHYWAREIQKFGHQTLLLNAGFVKSFVINHKNDFIDAEAIHTAALRPNKRTVATKTIAQQDMQMLHGFRQSLVDERTALVNKIRGHLSEYGIVVPKCISRIRNALPEILENKNESLSILGKRLFTEMQAQLIELDGKIAQKDQEIKGLCQQNDLSKRLLDIPGIGPISASLIASDIGDGSAYKTCRDYAASIGVVPKQHSSGGKQVLLGITKNGNKRIRTLLIHGARAVIAKCSGKSDSLSLWLQSLVERRGFNKAAVALANKNARIIWSLTKTGKEYEACVA